MQPETLEHDEDRLYAEIISTLQAARDLVRDELGALDAGRSSGYSTVRRLRRALVDLEGQSVLLFFLMLDGKADRARLESAQALENFFRLATAWITSSADEVCPAVSATRAGTPPALTAGHDPSRSLSQ